MTILRLSNGADVEVTLSVAEVVEALEAKRDGKGFLELETSEGTVQLRPAAVIAILEGNRKGRAGFLP